MTWLAASLQENLNLEHEEFAKIIFFIMKAIAAIAYVFVLGYLAAGMPVDGAVWLILVIGAAFDLAPELYTIKIALVLPKRAQTLEFSQLFLTAVAYIWLVTHLFIWSPFSEYIGYVVFAIIWIVSFIVEEATFFLLRSE